MPELAEVEFYRQQWDPGRLGRILAVRLHPQARVFRGTDTGALVAGIRGARLQASAAAAKQLCFQFSGGQWLGVHLGMSGSLTVAPAEYQPGRHDHLVLVQRARCLVFSDPRMFGRVHYARGRSAPAWWARLPPPVLSREFTPAGVAAFLRRRARLPLKSALLLQARFPGIGNWMADEILWRAALHPRRPAGALTPAELRRLWRTCREVCRDALRVIAGHRGRRPPDLNAGIPAHWLFLHRWRPGGRCPRTGVRLRRATIGGRTTCWSPARQRLPRRRGR